MEGGIEPSDVVLPPVEEERPKVAVAGDVQPSLGFESEEICIHGPDRIEVPETFSMDKEVIVVQSSFELETLGEVDVAKLPAVESDKETEKLPSAEVGVELKKSDFDIAIQPPSVEAATELRVGPAAEIEVGVPTAETVQEAAVPPETETVTYIVHYDEPVSAKPSPDDITVSLKKRRAGADEVRVLLRPLHEPLTADDVTSASGLQSLRNLVVVAIDIGTTFSGYAFTLKGRTHSADRLDEDGEQQQQQKHKQHIRTVSIFNFFITKTTYGFKFRVHLGPIRCRRMT